MNIGTVHSVGKGGVLQRPREIADRAPRDSDAHHMLSIDDDLAQLIRRQHGLITIRQLAAAGFRGDQVTRRVEAGHWTRLTRAVVRVSMQPQDRLSQLWTAALHYDGARLAGSSALEVLGLPAPKDGVIHLMGTRTGRAAPLPHCVMHTQLRADEVCADPDRSAVLPATVQSLKWARTDRQAAFQAIWPIQRGLVELESLQMRVRELPAGHGTSAARRRMALIIPGTHSLRELEFANGCRRRGLPEPIRQRLRIDSEGRARYTDAEFTVAGRTLVVEIDGMQHLDAGVRIDDEWRANEFAIAGSRVLHVSTFALRVEPDRVYAQLQRALQGLQRAA